MIGTYIFSMFVLGMVLFFSVSITPSFAEPGGCPVNMTPIGRWCVDMFEASVWSQPPKNNGDPQGQQFGATFDNYPCSDNGNDCSDTASNPIYAASVPGVTPSAFITWFQAQQACANVGKQLLPNAIWQMVAAGTPDTGGADDGSTTCNTDDLEPGVAATGSRTNCVSNWGIFDMVGNVSEWVEDWMQDNDDLDGTFTSTALYGNDRISGVDEAFPVGDGFPAGLLRGGAFSNSTDAGVFALDAAISPSGSLTSGEIGFRCAR